MDYEVTATVEETLELLATRENVRLIAGGTDLTLLLADGLVTPSSLIDVSRVAALRGIRAHAAGLAIGAATCITEIAADSRLPACLRQGARSIGSPQIRNLGTIGGNIVNASPCGDTLAPLVALDARFVLREKGGSREVSAESFFVAPKKTIVRPRELLVEIMIDSAHLAGGSAFRMIGKRNAQAISQVNAAVWLAVEKGIIRDARAAVGSVAPVPLRLTGVERLLRGKDVVALRASARRDSREALAEILEAVDQQIKPISDVRATLDYRRLVTAALFRDALSEALGD